MKWIEITEQPSKAKKTKLFNVRNKEQDCHLGQIKWYPPFRKYSFFPVHHLVFESTCLDDISGFLKQLMTDHKKSKVSKPPAPDWFPSVGNTVMVPPQPGENAVEAVVTFIYSKDSCRVMDPDSKTEWDATIKSLTPKDF